MTSLPNERLAEYLKEMEEEEGPWAGPQEMHEAHEQALYWLNKMEMDLFKVRMRVREERDLNARHLPHKCVERTCSNMVEPDHNLCQPCLDAMWKFKRDEEHDREYVKQRSI